MPRPELLPQISARRTSGQRRQPSNRVCLILPLFNAAMLSVSKTNQQFHMKMSIPLLIGCLVAAFTLTGSAQSIPSTVNYQCTLTDAVGHPLPDADYVLTFRIYDAIQGGDLVWGPQVFDGSGATGHKPRPRSDQGRVNVILGPVDVQNRSLIGAFDAPDRWVEIQVGDSAPISPRQQILSAPFAVQAATAAVSDTATNATKLAGYDWSSLFGANDPRSPILPSKLANDSIPASKLEPGSITESRLAGGLAVPVGGVIMWWGSIASLPENFEICDGSAPVTTGATLVGIKPDLRDRFVKGAVADANDVNISPVSGGAHFLNLQHDHEMDHVHGSGGLWTPISGGPRNAIWVGEVGGGKGFARGEVASGYGLVIGPLRGTSAEEQQAIRVGTEVTGNTGTASRTHTWSERQSLAMMDNRPAFLEMLFIIRVK